MNGASIETFAGLIPENAAPIIQAAMPWAILLLAAVAVIRVVRALAPALIAAAVLTGWIVAMQGPEGLEEVCVAVKSSLGVSANPAELLEHLRPWLAAISP